MTMDGDLQYHQRWSSCTSLFGVENRQSLPDKMSFCDLVRWYCHTYPRSRNKTWTRKYKMVRPKINFQRITYFNWVIMWMTFMPLPIFLFHYWFKWCVPSVVNVIGEPWNFWAQSLSSISTFNLWYRLDFTPKKQSLVLWQRPAPRKRSWWISTLPILSRSLQKYLME